MKNIRTKLCVTALALAIGVSPVLGCTTVPKANTNRSNGAFLTIAEAENERKSSVPVKPAPAPVVKPETKPAPVVKPETKPAPAPIVKPETKPAPAPMVKPETKPTPAPMVKPETKPTPAPILKPGTKPTPAPTTTPGACKPETKPTPAPIVKPGTKPTPAPEVKPNTCKPCKPGTKPCKPETKPETKPVGKFTIDNFKIIQQSLEKLGVSPSELDTMIKQGKKLIDVLNEKDISVNKFRKVLYKEYCLTIKEGVKNKQITKEEGKLLEAAIKQKVMSWMKDK